MRFGGAVDDHPSVFAARVLDHHYGVGAGRHGRSGHDFDRLSRAQFAGESFAGAHFADDLQLARKIDGADGIAVAHGAGEGGRIAVCRDIHGKYASGSFRERDLFRYGTSASLAHGAQHGFAGIGKG